MPILQARERLKELEVVNAQNIFDIHYLAFGNEKLARRLQDKWMMQESLDNSRRQ